MKSLSAYSSEKGFNVSSLGANAICIKSDFVQTFLFSPSPPVAHVDGFKGGTLPPHVFLCVSILDDRKWESLSSCCEGTTYYSVFLSSSFSGEDKL